HPLAPVEEARAGDVRVRAPRGSDGRTRARARARGSPPGSPPEGEAQPDPLERPRGCALPAPRTEASRDLPRDLEGSGNPDAPAEAPRGRRARGVRAARDGL